MPLRNLVLLGLVVSTIAASAPASAESIGGAASRLTLRSRHGVAVLLPSSWHVVHRRLTPCIDPSERLTVAGRGGLVMLQERLHSVAGDFPARAATFELRGRPEFMECCAPLTRRGWMLRFEENGRGFYAYVYLGASGTRAEALAILDSLSVRSQPS